MCVFGQLNMCLESFDSGHVNWFLLHGRSDSLQASRSTGEGMDFGEVHCMF